MLPGMPSHIEALKTAVDINQSFVEKIVTSAVGMFENSQVSQLVSNMINECNYALYVELSQIWQDVQVYITCTNAATSLASFD